MENSFELFAVEHEVDVSYDGEHDHQEAVEQNEILEVFRHFSNDCDEWADFLGELDDVNYLHDDAGDHDCQKILKFLVDNFIQICQCSEELLLLINAFCFYTGLNFELNPVSRIKRDNKEDEIGKKAYRWKGELSLQFSKEYKLDDLGEEEHQVEVAE